LSLKLLLPALALAAALTAVIGLPLCNSIFDCGCTWIFAGADAHCDIHRAGPPDCPLCANWLLGTPFFAGLFAAWALVILRALQSLGRPKDL
jgi:hypothetical protein